MTDQESIDLESPENPTPADTDTPDGDAPVVVVVAVHVAVTLNGHHREQTFHVELQTTGDAGEAARRVCWPLVADAETWLHREASKVRINVVRMTGTAEPVTVRTHLLRAWRQLLNRPTHTARPLLASSGLVERLQQRPGGVESATVTSAVTIGDDVEKSFTTTASGAGNIVKLATQIVKTTVGDLQAWAYDWSTAQAVEANRRKRGW